MCVCVRASARVCEGSQIFLHKIIKQNWPPCWHTLIYTNLMRFSGFFFLKVKKREKENHVHSMEAFCQLLNCGKIFTCCLKKSLKTSPVQQRLSNSTLLTDWSRPIPLTLWNGLRVRRPSGTTPIILLHLYSLFWKWGLGLTQKDSVSKGISSSITYWRLWDFSILNLLIFLNNDKVSWLHELRAEWCIQDHKDRGRDVSLEQSHGAFGSSVCFSSCGASKSDSSALKTLKTIKSVQ